MTEVQKSASDWIDSLGLVRHPEGGYYREIYRSSEILSQAGLPPRFDGPRSVATSIIYLLPAAEVSCLHRLRSDEVWHFYEGGPLWLAIIRPDGLLREVWLGRLMESGHVLQAAIPAGSWFGAAVPDPGGYALAGCTVAPGFEFGDFEIGLRDALLRTYPQHRSIIEKLTR